MGRAEGASLGKPLGANRAFKRATCSASVIGAVASKREYLCAASDLSNAGRTLPLGARHLPNRKLGPALPAGPSLLRVAGLVCFDIYATATRQELVGSDTVAVPLAEKAVRAVSHVEPSGPRT
jgi:hypothetical protein